MAANGSVTYFPVPTGNSFVTDITSGPDGALWFTERTGSRVGRITTDGSITEYEITSGSNPIGVPNEGVVPASIVVGPDGALWFTEGFGDRIGRVTTSGEISEYPIPTRDTIHGQPEGIAVGPDGAIWFVTVLEGRIWRLDVETKEFTPFAMAPGLAMATQSLGKGPGGIWLVGGGTVAEMSTDGTWTTFPAPNTGKQPAYHTDRIAPAADGSMWFTETGSNRIGRITADGRITEVAVPTPDAGVGGIAVGPDGTVWFTESRTHRIGRIQP